jgi:S1-C subfamily serine protease
MSETSPPPAGSEGAVPVPPVTPAAPPIDASATPIPLGPVASEYPLAPSYPHAGADPRYAPTGSYPPAGPDPRYANTGSYPPAAPYPYAQYPTEQNPAGAGWPPPPGTWTSTPRTEWGAGMPPGGGPGSPLPPAGSWPPPPGFSPPYQQQPVPAKRRRSPVVALATVAVVVAVLAGAGLGRVVWPGTTTGASSAGVATPGGSNSSGGDTSPFGNGSSGGDTSPFGSGSTGSTGNSSTGAGAPSDISAIAAKVDPGLVDINTNLSYEDEQAAGTGMVLTSTGEILTNNHVIDGATSISVTDVGNGRTYSANVVGYDRTGDVAVIKLVGASGLQTVTPATAKASVGQAVVGIGNAGGTGGTPSTAGGAVTALDQSITASDDGSGGNAENLTGLIETNAGIQPGDSGGSLVNTSGQVIGMDTAASEDNGFQTSGSQGYAIPIGTALSLARVIEAGDASSTVHIGATGFLGVEVVSSGSGSDGSGDGTGGLGGGFGGGFGGGTGDSGGSTATGASVQGVVSGSPADKAGLAEGDVITAVNGSSVTSASDLSNLLEGDHPGDSVQIQWTDSSGQSQTATVSLTSGPPA